MKVCMAFDMSVVFERLMYDVDRSSCSFFTSRVDCGSLFQPLTS